jgi:hypothetical protein
MEEFLFKLIKINDKVNVGIEKEKDSKKLTNIVKPSIKTKQYLVYYLYRILCKNSKLIKKVGLDDDINNIFKSMGVSKNNSGCESMTNKMSNDSVELENLVINMMEILNNFNETRDSLLPDTYYDFYIFLEEKSKGNQIRNDLEELSVLVPNLSVPESKP